MFVDSQILARLALISRQIPHYTEITSGQMPGVGDRRPWILIDT